MRFRNYGCVSVPDVRLSSVGSAEGTDGTSDETTALLQPLSRSESSITVAVPSPIAVSSSFLRFSPLQAAHMRTLSCELTEQTQIKSGSLPSGDDGRFKLTHRDRMIIAMLAFANLSATVIYSCIAPFFPLEAAMKGATETSVGFIFGIFELTIFFVSPVVGRVIHQVGSKFLYGTGLCATAVTSVLFGLLNWSPPGTMFIVLAIMVRVFEGIGDACFLVASFTIITHTFPTRGVLETFSGLGYSIGPPIGGALYELGGFQTPFWTLAILLLTAGVISFFIIPKQKDQKLENKSGFFRMLGIPAFLLMIYCVMIATLSLSFMDPNLEPHLSEYNLSKTVIGLVFLLAGLIYTFTAPLIGYIVDHKDWTIETMIGGSVLAGTAFAIFGPSPILRIPKTLWLVILSQIFLGFSIAAMMIPPFQHCLYLVQAALGPSIGGIVVEFIGIRWAATIISAFHFITACLLIAYRCWSRRRNQELDNSEQRLL